LRDGCFGSDRQKRIQRDSSMIEFKGGTAERAGTSANG
jgi:hypothetical protein